MNTIYFSRRHELKENYYVIPFSCSDLIKFNIDTEVSFRDRTETAQKVLDTIVDRITLALYNQGYILQNVSFRTMSISAIVDEMSTKVSYR
jgi:hypothetical protein